MKKINTFLFSSLAVIVLTAAFLWSANENQKLAEKTIEVQWVMKGLWKIEFQKESNYTAFEKSIAKFRNDHPGQSIALYTLPKEMWPDPKRPVVYIFTNNPENSE